MNIRYAVVLTSLSMTAATSPPATFSGQERPALGQTITTPSGLKYRFTKLGSGPRPQAGDLMVIHGIGAFPDGKEFWNTRTDNTPYEYTFGVDRVIRGFEEGMREVREGDRVVITMTPDLAYGDRARPDIPANSTLVFDYEILAIKTLTVARFLRDGFAAGTVEAAIASAKALPNLKDYYASVASLRSAANAANAKQAGENEKVLAFAMTLLPDAYQLPMSLARAQAQRGAVAGAIRTYEAALKLNPNKTPAEIRDAAAMTTALAELRKR